MPIEKYNEIIDGMHQSIREQLDAIPKSEGYPSITSIEYDDQFLSIKMISSTSQLGLSEMFVSWTAALPACMYQQLAGQIVSCIVFIVDQDGAEIQKGTYPDA